ncbi:MAG: hypothetical protein EZS28_007038 [Streblomastix strix]|uniref:Uncharacterized protein n=1 Tax=Streblomastix strix TaxID=222440 RepID=A0A5J4WQS0_9EUKA|nr:MAG: hypothetical protein EZS28_007038 [Streblomastix strix]
MNQAQTLKNLTENGTSIEYFNNGYIMQVKDKIKVYEEGKKSARTLTQAQQTKLLLEAIGGGQPKPKLIAKRQVESDFETAQARRHEVDDDDDETSFNDRKFIYEEQLMNDFEDDDDQVIVEKPVKTLKPTQKKTIKKPQINYTSPQVDLEELIRLRTENSFIKQQHQDSVKQIEKYKAKIKSYKSKNYQEETAQAPPIPVQEQNLQLHCRRVSRNDIFQPLNTSASIRFYLQHTLENPQPPIPYSVIPYNQFETVMISI